MGLASGLQGATPTVLFLEHSKKPERKDETPPDTPFGAITRKILDHNSG